MDVWACGKTKIVVQYMCQHLPYSHSSIYYRMSLYIVAQQRWCTIKVELASTKCYSPIQVEYISQPSLGNHSGRWRCDLVIQVSHFIALQLQPQCYYGTLPLLQTNKVGTPLSLPPQNVTVQFIIYLSNTSQAAVRADMEQAHVLCYHIKAPIMVPFFTHSTKLKVTLLWLIRVDKGAAWAKRNMLGILAVHYDLYIQQPRTYTCNFEDTS